MKNWREIPFVRFVLPLIAGILLYGFFPFNRTILFIAMLLIAVLSLVISKKQFIYELRWVYGFCLNLTVFLFGWWLAGYSYSNHFQAFTATTPEPTAFLVKLNSKPILKNKLRVTASVISLTANNEQHPVNGRLLLYFEPTPQAKQLEYGDLIQLNTPITEIQPPANPDAYNFQQVMRYAYIEHQAFPKEAEWESLNINQGNWIHRTAYSFQDQLLHKINTKLNGEQEKIVASALLLGDRSRITPELKAAYADTGAMHILAVSGLHVGLLFLVFSWLLQLIKIKRWYWRYLKAGLLICAVWGFALITGLAPSVVRAAAMLSFIIVGITIHRNGNIYNTIAASAFVLLVINPNYIYQVGFQLSYLALLGIIYYQPKFYRLLQIGNPVLDKIWALITVSLSAQVLTFPISLYYFHQFPIYFWLSGIVVVPAATIILPLGICLFVFGNVPFIGSIIAISLEKILWLMNALVIGIQHLPFATAKGVWLTLPMTLLLYAIVLCFTLVARKAGKKYLLIGFAAIASFITVWMVNMIQHNNQSFVTVYSFSDRSLLDFAHGRTVYSFASSLEEDNSFKYAVSNHRNRNGINQVVRFSLDREGDFPGLSSQNGVISFNGKRYLLLTDELETTSLAAADYLIVCGIQALDIDSFLEENNFKEVVFDRACNPRLVRNWKQICKAKNQPFHDIRTSGYWQP